MISSFTYSSFPDLSCPTAITISISSAPSSMATFVSYTLEAIEVAPSGNPTTVQTLTSVSFKFSYASLTQLGFTQTDANHKF